jgi:amino acid transporter
VVREAPSPSLHRVLTLGPLILYGLGVIVGAGIYVAVGAVMARAGQAAPLSFVVAGLAAAMTGLCYAELGGRFPEASGSVSYTRHGFRSDRIARIVGAAVTLAVAIAAASIARGTAQYLGVLVPLPEPVLVTLIILSFTGIAMIGVRESVGIAAVMSLIEITGLLAATAAGLLAAPDLDLRRMLPESGAAWGGVLSGAFLAFFAFIGFETLANMAEEVKEPRRTLPRGIIGAVAISVVLYVAVVAAIVLSGKVGAHPLLMLFPGMGAMIFAGIGVIAVANGVLVQIVMLARLFYGMASQGQLPARLAVVNPRTRTPLRATMLGGGTILVMALVVPFERLLVAANMITLGVFTLVAGVVADQTTARGGGLRRVHRSALGARGRGDPVPRVDGG